MCEVLAGRRPDLHFVMIGDGAMATDVDAAAARWDSDHRFHRVPHLPDAGRAMAAFDVFVLPSLYEGGPYAPLEAMRAGIPVVATDVTGNRDVVIDGMTGYRFPPRQFESAAARVLELLDSPETRADLTTNASARLRENFDVEVMGRRYDELYESLVTSKRAR
jgi:glycosyltransferase involved in cell wall biosynthesis